MAPELGMGTFRIVNFTTGDLMWATSNGASEERWAYQAPINATALVSYQKVIDTYLSRNDFCQFLASEGQNPAALTLRFHQIRDGLDADGGGC